MLRPALLAAYRAALKQRAVRLIVQNPDDERLVLEQRLVRPHELRVIRGSGVDTKVFHPRAQPGGVPTFVLVARMLWDKGVGEFVDAARLLQQRNVPARCLLVGEADPENPAAIAREQLRRWHSEGHVEWWGHRSDMPEVLAGAHVACLPSYREGLPKSLLEGPYFDGGSHLVDQVYQPRLIDGMVRCYLVRDRVEGFGVQQINALSPAPRGAPATEAPQPGPRLYFPPSRSDLQPLKHLVESKWIGEMCVITGLTSDRLPLIWDLDFLYGPKDTAGQDTFVLGEINVSCVFPFPDSALAPLAEALRARLESR